MYQEPEALAVATQGPLVTRIFLRLVGKGQRFAPKFTNVRFTVRPRAQSFDIVHKSPSEIEAKSDANKHRWPNVLIVITVINYQLYDRELTNTHARLL